MAFTVTRNGFATAGAIETVHILDATAADVVLELGYIPSRIEVLNYTDGVHSVHVLGMPLGTSVAYAAGGASVPEVVTDEILLTVGETTVVTVEAPAGVFTKTVTANGATLTLLANLFTATNEYAITIYK